MRTPSLLARSRELSLLLLTGCAASAAKEAAPPAAAIAVQVATVGVAGASPAITATGRVAAKEEVPLAFKIGGVVQSVRVRPGDRVRAGQTLAVLAPEEIGNEVTKARLARDKASRDLARVRALHADSVATLEQLQDATTAFDVAQANVGIAEFNQRYAVITAPADGIVLERLVEPNQLVAPGAAALRLRTQRDGVILRVGLPDRDAARVRVGDAATVYFEAGDARVVTGRVSQVGVAAAERTGTFDVEIALRDAPGTRTLASGLVGRAEIVPRTSTTTTRQAIPIEALVEAVGDTATIYTLGQSGTARRQQVVITGLDGSAVVLRDPLPAGTQVITAGSAFVVDGSRVTLATSARDSARPTTGGPR